MHLLSGSLLITISYGSIFVVFIFLALFGYLLDKRELKKCDVVFVKPIKECDDNIYSLTLFIQKVHFTKGITDIIIRLRGSLRNSPLILYRDSFSRTIRSGKSLNIGFCVPFNLGKLQKVDIVADNSEGAESENIFSFSDLSIRKLDKKIWTDDQNSLNPSLQTWHANKTVTFWNKGGAFNPCFNRKITNQDVYIRSSALTLQLDEKISRRKHRAKRGFFASHYLFSLISTYHEIWGDFSHQDIFMIVGLDLLSNIVVIVCVYALGCDELLPSKAIHQSLFGLHHTNKTIGIEKFEVQHLLDDLHNEDSNVFYENHLLYLIHQFFVALTSTLLLVPFSFLWRKMFGIIGGKGFYQKLSDNQLQSGKTMTVVPRSFQIPATKKIDLSDSIQNFVLRTLEIRNRHTVSCSISSRHFRTETVITNCSPNKNAARSLAFIRTKFCNLEDGDVTTGSKNLRNPNIMHESRTISTDVPQIDGFEILDNKNNEIMGVSRFCERLVQQVTEYLMDNSLVSECYVVIPRSVNQNSLEDYHQPNNCNIPNLLSKSVKASKSGCSYHTANLSNKPSVIIGGRSNISVQNDMIFDGGCNSKELLNPVASESKETAEFYEFCDGSEYKKSKSYSLLLRACMLRFNAKYKTLVFVAVCFVQMLEISFLTLLPISGNRFFEDQYNGSSANNGRMHACLISFIFLFLIYPLITCNLIASLRCLSLSVENYLRKIFCKKSSEMKYQV